MADSDTSVIQAARETILRDIHRERLRQDQLKAEGRFAYTCADPEMTHSERLTVLGEEFGETCHEVNEGIGANRKVNLMKLRKELIQVAAVAMAWIESVEREINTKDWVENQVKNP